MKFKYIEVRVYKNTSNKFDIGYCQTKVKVIVRLLNYSPFTAIQSVRFHNSTLVPGTSLEADIKLVCLSDNNIYIL